MAKGQKAQKAEGKTSSGKLDSLGGIPFKIGNVPMRVDGNMLYLAIDLEAEGVPSGSGKSTIVASTRGNKPVLGTETGAVISVNCYIPD